MSDPAVTGIVLAGGRATRFGGPKLDALVDGEPLLTRATRAVAVVAAEVLIAGPAPEAIDDVGGVEITVVPDTIPFGGPLVALAGALGHAQRTFALVVAGDMPRLVPAVLRAMVERLASADALDAVTLESPVGDSAEPRRRATLPLALRVGSTASVAAEAVSAGDRSLARLLDRIRCVEIPTSEWLALDPDGASLFDVDRPADLDRITRELR